MNLNVTENYVLSHKANSESSRFGFSTDTNYKYLNPRCVVKVDIKSHIFNVCILIPLDTVARLMEPDCHKQHRKPYSPDSIILSKLLCACSLQGSHK